MIIERFTEEDIREAAHLSYPVWGEGHAANGQGEEFGLLMCEYIIRYGWYGAPFAFKITDEGKMVGCILAGDIEQDNGYNEWLDSVMPSFNEQQRAKALALRDYFGKTSPKVYRHMRADKNLYLSFFISAVQGSASVCLQRLWLWQRAKATRASTFGPTHLVITGTTLITVLRKLPSSKVMSGRPTPTIT